MTSESAKGLLRAIIIPDYAGEYDLDYSARRYLAEAIERLVSQTHLAWFAVIIFDMHGGVYVKPKVTYIRFGIVKTTALKF